MFISPAFAQGAGGGGGGIETMLPLVLIFAVFYFLLIRPQQKKAKAHRNMLSVINRGDKVITNGGIMGTVTKVVSDQELAEELLATRTRPDGLRARPPPRRCRCAVRACRPPPQRRRALGHVLACGCSTLPR